MIEEKWRKSSSKYFLSNIFLLISIVSTIGVSVYCLEKQVDTFSKTELVLVLLIFIISGVLFTISFIFMSSFSFSKFLRNNEDYILSTGDIYSFEILSYSFSTNRLSNIPVFFSKKSDYKKVELSYMFEGRIRTIVIYAQVENEMPTVFQYVKFPIDHFFFKGRSELDKLCNPTVK